MASYVADVAWTVAAGDDYRGGRYARNHAISFDGGATLKASASPHVVGKWSDPGAVDPEEMLVAALSSCHMLVFLHVARQAGFDIAAYRDHAEGTMGAVGPGRQAVTKVVLNPQVEWVGAAPDAAKLAELHHKAHEGCIIANSVTTEVVVA